MNNEMTQMLELNDENLISAIIKMFQQERDTILEMKRFKIKKRYSKFQKKNKV